MPAFTVESVNPEHGQPWSNNYGTFHPYKVMVLEDGQVGSFEAEWSRKANPQGQSRPPDVGLKIEAELQRSDYGVKLKGVKVLDGAGGGGQQSWGGGGGRASGGDEDSRGPRIERQHSQEMALRALELGYTLSVPGLAVPESEAAYRGLLRQWANFFDADIKAATE